MRLASKKIRSEQERELKEFRESQKQEMRLLKQEVDLMPKDRRKSMFKDRKEKLETEHEERVSDSMAVFCYATFLIPPRRIRFGRSHLLTQAT